MKISTVCFALLIVYTLISCEDSSDESVPLRWVPSDLSKYGSGFSNFSIGDDGQLYAIGFSNNEAGTSEYGVFRSLSNYRWENILKLDRTKFFAVKFAVFKNEVYLIMYEIDNSLPYYTSALWKGSGTSLEKITTSNSITDVAQFKGKLIVTGEIANAVFSTYDGNIFTQVPGPSEPFGGGSYLSLQTTERLYLRDNFSSYEFDGTLLTKIEKHGGINAVDYKGNLYSITENQNKTQILRNDEKVGDEFEKGIHISNIFFNRGKLVAIGRNFDTGFSVTFHLDRNVWKPVPTTNNFSGAFEYDSRIFAYEHDGMIAELVIQ